MYWCENWICSHPLQCTQSMKIFTIMTECTHGCFWSMTEYRFREKLRWVHASTWSQRCVSGCTSGWPDRVPVADSVLLDFVRPDRDAILERCVARLSSVEEGDSWVLLRQSQPFFLSSFLFVVIYIFVYSFSLSLCSLTLPFPSNENKVVQTIYAMPCLFCFSFDRILVCTHSPLPLLDEPCSRRRLTEPWT